MGGVPLTHYLARRDRGGTAPTGPSKSDIEAATQAWYQKGLAEGMEKAKAVHDAALAKQEDQFKLRIELARRLWTEAEGARLTRQLSQAIASLKAGIENTAARVLLPLVEKKLTDEALAKLAAELEKLFSDDDAIKLKICGRPDLVCQLSNQIPADVPVTVMTGDHPEVTVIANKTLIETRLGEWLARVGVSSHAEEEVQGN